MWQLVCTDAVRSLSVLPVVSLAEEIIASVAGATMFLSGDLDTALHLPF
jgi:hypothetical protein